MVILDATPTNCPTVYMGWGDVGMLTFHWPRSLDLAEDVDASLAWGGVGWGGVGMFTFLRPRSLDLAQDVDATLTWGGVGWGGDVHVSSTTFPRPCTRFWCYTHMGRGRVGWGCSRSFNHVPSTLHKNLMLRSHGAGWRCWRSFDHVPLTLHKIFMLCLHGVG